MSPLRSRESSLRLARETRERFAAAIEALLAPVAVAVRQQLDEASAQVATARAMQEHRDDFLAFREREPAWLSNVRAAWHRLAVQEAGTGRMSSAPAGLRLIDDEVVENNILSSRLALAILDQVSFELNDLRLRIQELEGRADLDTGDVLRPESLARVLVEQWLAAGLTRPQWNRVQEALRQQLLGGVLAAYEAANAYLIGQGVMPQIDLKRFVRRTGATASNASPLAASGSPVGTWTLPGRASGVPRSAGGMAGRVGMPGAFAPAAIGLGAGHVPPGLDDGGDTDGLAAQGAPFALARQRAQGVLLNLRRFVAGQLGGEPSGGRFGDGAQAPQDGTARAAGTDAFMAAIADAGAAYSRQAAQSSQGTLALQQDAADLRRRTSELKRKAPTTADKATVEIVALMFQAILAEERIPFSARVWFARLQMPVLRVAIAEPAFFGTLQHPARMLIDRMGSCVMGFDAAAISGSALEGEIRRVVQVIEQYPETGQRVFKLVYEEFVAFLSKYLTRTDATQRLMSVAQQVEQKETMAIQYTIELRKMLDDMPVPEEIRQFLFKVWAEVLALAALRHGVQDERTLALKRAASELVWAASAKPHREDRLRVIQGLPRLLQRLREGMTLLGVVGAPQESHMKLIGDTLTHAFMSKTEVIAPARIEAMAARLANIEDFVGEGGADDLRLDSASIELLLGVDAASLEVVPDTGVRVGDEMRAWASELQVGTWFMLDHNGQVNQVQFVWRSEHRQLHLFASAHGRSFLIQAGRLASYLQAGLLVPAEEEVLTVRATREALAKLDANPERLLD
ncbi:MAG: hypothetical protein JWQ03_1902 [Variovorax sp.]|nr:hypothetical protein [Variovorax sp.]